MSEIKNIIVSLIFLVYIFPMSFKAYGAYGMYIIYDGIPIAFLVYNYNIVINFLQKAKHYVLKFMSIYILTLLWGLISVAINSGDYTYFDLLLRIVQSIIIYIFLMLVQLRVLGKVDLDGFMKFYVFAVSMYVFSTIIFLSNQDIKEYWKQLLVQNEIQLKTMEFVSQQTRFGLKGFSNFAETAICSIASMFSLYFMHKTKKIFNAWIFAFVICVLGCFFYGRIGIIATLIFFICFETFNFNVVNIKRFILILIFVLSILGVLFYLAENDTRIELWLMWLYKPIESFFIGLQYGQISFGPSADKLTEQMYFMPDELTLIFGDGFYQNNDGSYYMHTDAGVLRHILFYGVLGEIMGYSLILMLLFWLMKIFKYHKDKLRYIMVILFLPFLLLFEIKGVVYTSFIGLLFTILLLVVNDCD